MIELLLWYYGTVNIVTFFIFVIGFWCEGKDSFPAEFLSGYVFWLLPKLSPLGGAAGALFVMGVFKYRPEDYKIIKWTSIISFIVHSTVFTYLVLWERGIVS